MVAPAKHLVLWEYIMGPMPLGDIVECGVWRGGTSMLMASALIASGKMSRIVRLYDTFERLPPPDHEKDDIRAKKLWHNALKSSTILNDETFSSHYKKGKAFMVNGSVKWNYTHKQDVADNIQKTGYPMQNIKLIKGNVEHTLLDFVNIPERITVLRLDTDWYLSTKSELDILYPKLVPGGLLQIDDYCTWAGSRTATDEWLKKHRYELKIIDSRGSACFTAIRLNVSFEMRTYIEKQQSKLNKNYALIASIDPTIETQLYHRFLNLKDSFMGPVLCVGARLGGEVRAFKRITGNAIGIDFNPGKNNNDVVFGNAMALDFLNDTYGTIYCNILDHIPNLNKAYSEIARVLKPGGTVFFDIDQNAPDQWAVRDLRNFDWNLATIYFGQFRSKRIINNEKDPGKIFVTYRPPFK